MQAKQSKIRVCSLEDATGKLLEWLRSNGYGEDHINMHRQTANRLSRFMETNGISEYAPEVGVAFLKDYFSSLDVSYPYRNRVEMTVYRLGEFHSGNIPAFRRTINPRQQLAVGKSAIVLENYFCWCKTHGYKASTITLRRKFCEEFLFLLRKLGCDVIEEVKPEQISKACLMFKDKHAWSHIRMFLKYLHANVPGLCDYSSLVPSYRTPVVLPSVYTEEEIRKVETSIDRVSKTGKRDYAMLLLTTRYGLRSSDIVKLSFKELDFEGNRIRLLQEKTGVLWEAAMLPQVREALTDYIANARPDSDTDTVFLLSRAPFCEVRAAAFGSIITRCLIKAGIEQEGRRQGPHAFRSSLASSMVNDNVPYEVVRRVLGHDDPNAIKHYAKIDIERLRDYAIPVPEPSGKFASFLRGGGLS